MQFLVFLFSLAIASVSAKRTDNDIKQEAILNKGVSFDPTFATTENSPRENELSAPGCPTSEQDIPWLYFGSGENIKCYVVGSAGPCGRGQIFTPVPGTYTGYCNCECPTGSKKTELTDDENGPVQFCTGRRRENEREIIVHSEYTFIPQRKRCFELFSQEFCKVNEWLVRTVENGVRCETRRCPEGEHAFLNGNDIECGRPDEVGGVFSTVSEGPMGPCKFLKPDYVEYQGTCIKKVMKPSFD